MSSLEKTMTRLSSVFAARPRRRKNARGQTATEYLEPRVVMSATALSRVGQLAVGSALTSSSTTRSTGAPSHVADVLRAANTVTATSGGDSNDQMREAFNLGAISRTLTNTTHSISSSRDVDMFKFTVTGGQTVRFDIDHPSTSRLDSYIRLFDASGRQLRWSNNAAAPGESLGRDSYLQHTFSTSGTYYLGVSGAGNTSYSAVTGNGDRNGSTGSFNLTVSPVNTVTPPGGDSNDQMREAFNLGAISRTLTNTTHSISSSRDVDMFKFTVTGGQTVRFDIDHPSTSRLDSYIRLFDASGRQLRWSNNAAAPGESLGRDSYLQHTFSTSGTYYLGVSGAGNTSYSAVTGNGDRNGSTGSFNLTVSPVNTVTPPGRTPPTERFDSEPNNSSAQADFIGSFRRGRYSRTYYGSTGSGSDTQDWIRIRLEGRTTGSINLTGMYQDLDLRVYDSTGRLVGASLNGGARTDFVNLRNAAAGDY